MNTSFSHSTSISILSKRPGAVAVLNDTPANLTPIQNTGKHIAHHHAGHGRLATLNFDDEGEDDAAPHLDQAAHAHQHDTRSPLLSSFSPAPRLTDHVQRPWS